jgi:hypothetical protein
VLLVEAAMKFSELVGQVRTWLEQEGLQLVPCEGFDTRDLQEAKMLLEELSHRAIPPLNH